MNANKQNWKPIPEFPSYQIAPSGDIRRTADGYILKPQKAPTGHRMVLLVKDGKRSNLRVARLVGAVFCKTYRAELFPVYIDGDTWNVRSTNLKWVPRAKVAAAPHTRNPQPAAPVKSTLATTGRIRKQPATKKTRK